MNPSRLHNSLFMLALQTVDEASLAAAAVQSEEKEIPLAIARMAQDREA